MSANSKTDNLANEDCRPVPCSSFWYGVGAFFVAPVAAIFCVLMGLMLILAWPFIPFLCYMQRKEEISKANDQGQARSEAELSAPLCSHDFIPRLPVTPTKEEIMWELERMIHQWDDSPRPESAHGYHRDALWLEEVRHIIATQDKEIERLRNALQGVIDATQRCDDAWNMLVAVENIAHDAIHPTNAKGDSQSPDQKAYE